MRFLVLPAVLVVAGALACGGSNTQDELPEVDAGMPPEEGASLREPQAAAEAQRCLDLVGAGDYSAALPVCTSALRNEPENEALRDALYTAQRLGEGSVDEPVSDIRPDL